MSTIWKMGMANSVQLGAIQIRTGVGEKRMVRNIFIHWKVKEKQSVDDTKKELARR